MPNLAPLAIGQRVRTTVDAPAGWEGAFAAPAGAPGTVHNLTTNDGYGVVLDGDPDQMPVDYARDELAPVE